MINNKYCINIKNCEEHLLISMNDLLKELCGMRIFNFVHFDNLIYMKLYSPLISNKIQNYIKNNFKAL